MNISREFDQTRKLHEWQSQLLANIITCPKNNLVNLKNLTSLRPTGSVVTTLKATDVDTSDDNKLTFSLLSDSVVFTVDALSGAVRNKILLDRWELDT